MFPHFLCIGAQKAGTTWLHYNLAQQKGVWLPPVKEIHFLDHPRPTFIELMFSGRSHHKLARANVAATAFDVIRRRADLADFGLALKLAYAHRDWAWYESLFPETAGTLCGEICPGYARISTDVIGAIASRNPKIKIIYLLRDPIDRAWSALAMHFRKKPGSTIADDRPQDIIERMMSSKSFAHCQYEANIARWMEHLPADQLYFGFFERIEEDPTGYLEDILRFLDVPAAVCSKTAGERVNSSLGELIPPGVEGEIARLLRGEAASLHRRFANQYTERWLAHAELASRH
jgi:hypothetical protein